ncbi:MAG: LamG-like jellyroll fold domain-containing protein [Cytophagaceae bacterium]
MKKNLTTIFISFLTILNTYAQPAPTGLVSYYKFASTNSSSTKIEDESSNDNDGAVTNGLGFITDRHNNTMQAIQLGGADNNYNYVTINGSYNRTTINAINDISISIWYKKSDNSGSDIKPILTVEDNSGKYYSLAYNVTSNKVQWSHHNGTTESIPIVSTTTLTNDTWYNLAFTVDLTLNIAKLYVDGVLQGQSETAITKPVNPSIRLARGPGFTSPNFPADFDDLYIYNNVLSLSEITEVKNYCAATLPTAQGTSRCGSGTVTVSATGGTNYKWYADSIGGQPLHTSSSYLINNLSVTDTFYVSNTNLCESIRVKAIAIIKPLPEIPEISGVTTVEENSSETYTVEDHEGSSFTWQIIGGTGSSTSPEITVQWGSHGVGLLTVIETADNGCTNTSSIEVIKTTTEEPTATKNISILPLKIYPNPSQGVLTIDYSGSIKEVSLTNLWGQQEVFFSKEISTSFKGLVFVVLKTENEIFSEKVIVQ